jgi:dephospho-CoA kinase
MAYFGLKQVEEIRGRDGRVLLGITGGIASGKSMVAGMLHELGAATIDFDVLSRVVVEPGKEAWKEIVAFFGAQVLREDRTLDRKKISEIVFRDPEKRKKLEGFIHPRIYEEFAARIGQLTRKDPQAIIQAVVPLLIEANLQHLFHKVLVVSVSEETQIKRLMERDGISREMARNILSAQLPLGEKKAYADYLVDNSGSIAETKRQVLEVWEEIKKFQGTREDSGR